MVFVIGLPISTNWKSNSYDSIFIIIERLNKMVYYKSIKITINILGLATIMINIIVQPHGFFDSIISNYGMIFIFKFWFLFCFFFNIKRKFFITFYFQKNDQTK